MQDKLKSHPSPQVIGVGGLLNSPLPKAGAHFTRTPLCQATMKSQISLAGGKAVFKCIVRVDITERAEEDPLHIQAVLGTSVALYCLNVK